MKRLLILLAFVSNSILLFGQAATVEYEVDNSFNWWNKRSGDDVYIFADIAYIRDQPSVKGQIIDSLAQGYQLKILSNECYNPSTIRGFSAPWQKVSFMIGSTQKEGFIWLGLLALDRKIDEDGDSFLYGVLRYEKETSYAPATYLVQLKCLDSGNLLKASQIYPAELDGQSFSEYKILPHMGLEGLKSIHRIGFMGEACGIYSHHYYFSWDGQVLNTMFHKSAMGDAGYYFYEEKVLFPSEHKLAANLIIKDSEEGTVIDDKDPDPKFNIKRKRKKYHWDGKRVSEIIEMSSVK